ncbi:hypothetical protein ABTZ93_36110 [Streptomyces sp. NPDC097941]|uniref:hypothetical protein n=1 Tax=Streptomyces sp. NPDC097941 TaxID=3155685 RepID=UPI00332978FC
MLLEKGRAAYYDSSGTTSSIIRQLALAGIAVVWLLAGGLQKDGVHLTQILLAAGLLIVISLFLDLAQYVWTTACLAVWVWSKERKARKELQPGEDANVDEKEIGDAPSAVLPIMWVLFYLKAAATATAYILIGFDLGNRLNVS